MLERLEHNIENWLPEEFEDEREEILTEAKGLLRFFAGSEAYAELRDATILGREVPFIMPWPSHAEVGVGGARFAGPPPTLMEGRIDLLYEKGGGLWVADYKTDRVAEADVAERMKTYRPQAKAYTEAVRQAVGREPAGFKLIFLRLGKSVPIQL